MHWSVVREEGAQAPRDCGPEDGGAGAKSEEQDAALRPEQGGNCASNHKRPRPARLRRILWLARTVEKEKNMLVWRKVSGMVLT